MRATNAAHRGATALVPPKTSLSPSTNTLYPVLGSASPATSGTPRPPVLPDGLGTSKPFCHAGNGNTSLTPPPVLPPPVLFHTTSLTISPFEACNVVPPQANA